MRLAAAVKRMARISRGFWRAVERHTLLALRLLRRIRGKLRTGMRKAIEPRQLKLREQITVGEKRTVAIVDCGEESFLIGCTAQSVNLLAKLPARREFTDHLAEQYEMAIVQ